MTPGRRALMGYVVAWLLAAGLAVTVGVVAVTSVGASIRGRGPLGVDAADYVAQADDVEGAATPDPDDPEVGDTFTGAFGAFEVTCQGALATRGRAVPATGWRTLSVEEGPDDDVDVVFSDGDRTVGLEVFCNQGRPTLSEREVKTLGPDDDGARRGDAS